jgi:hypothetical protein
MASRQRGGPRVHDADGVARVSFVAGEVPRERLGVGGGGVAALVLAAEVRRGARPALDLGARARRVVGRSERAREQRGERRLLRLGARGHALLQQVELGTVEQHAWVAELLRVGGEREESGEQQREAAHGCLGT